MNWLPIVGYGGYDAVHLASVLTLRERVSSEVAFLAFDRALMMAARREALHLHSLVG